MSGVFLNEYEIHLFNDNTSLLMIFPHTSLHALQTSSDPIPRIQKWSIDSGSKI